MDLGGLRQGMPFPLPLKHGSPTGIRTKARSVSPIDRPAKSGLEPGPAVQVPLLGNCARQQFFEIPAFQSSSLDDDVIDFVHGILTIDTCA